MPRGIYDHHKLRGRKLPPSKLRGKKRIPREMRICECGCKKTFECKVNSKQRFIYCHRGRIPRIDKEIRICKCGCRETFECKVNSKKKYNQIKFKAARKYAAKHNMIFLVWTENILFDEGVVVEKTWKGALGYND